MLTLIFHVDLNFFMLILILFMLTLIFFMLTLAWRKGVTSFYLIRHLYPKRMAEMYGNLINF